MNACVCCLRKLFLRSVPVSAAPSRQPLYWYQTKGGGHSLSSRPLREMPFSLIFQEMPACLLLQGGVAVHRVRSLSPSETCAHITRQRLEMLLFSYDLSPWSFLLNFRRRHSSPPILPMCRLRPRPSCPSASAPETYRSAAEFKFSKILYCVNPFSKLCLRGSFGVSDDTGKCRADTGLREGKFRFLLPEQGEVFFSIL